LKRTGVNKIFHSKRLPCGGKQRLRVKIPEARKAKSTAAVDLEGSYVSTDRGGLGRRVKGRKGDRFEPSIKRVYPIS
jgi:hypothetical protein